MQCSGAGLPAASALQSQMQAVVPKIEDLMRGCKERQTGCMNPTVDEIVDLCLKSDLAFKRNILGRNCGIHPENRAKSGVDPINAQDLALRISLQGYSESKLENPMGFEKAASGTTAESAQEKFMRKNFAMSNGYLRTIPFRDVEYLPVTCSHTFAALNIIDGSNIRGLHEKLCTNGYVDQQKTIQLCKSWEKPLRDGIPCIVFRRELEAACPELPGFLSIAGNQSHEVHQKETKIQFMLSLHQLFTAASASTRSAGAASTRWAHVVSEMGTIKPHFANCAKEAAEFAAAWSGGDQSPALHEAEAYAKTLKARKEPEDGQLGILANA